MKHAQATSITVELRFGSNDLMLEVADDGVGFDSEVAATKNVSWGYGLTIMRERAEAMGGHTSIISTPGAGTKVICQIPYQVQMRLPVVKEVNAGDNSVGPPDHAPARSGICTVLLVDDHELVRQGTRAILEYESDIEVVGEAIDGEQAVEMAAALKPDVILMDIHMPKMNGIQATRAILENDSQQKVIMLTVISDDDYLREGIRAGALGYLLKGCSQNELVSGVRSLNADNPSLSLDMVRALAASESSGKTPRLTDRELEVLQYLADGDSSKQIAERLILSVNTVNFHIHHIYEKLEVTCRVQAVNLAHQMGLLELKSQIPA